MVLAMLLGEASIGALPFMIIPNAVVDATPAAPHTSTMMNENLATRHNYNSATRLSDRLIAVGHVVILPYTILSSPRSFQHLIHQQRRRSPPAQHHTSTSYFVLFLQLCQLLAG